MENGQHNNKISRTLGISLLLLGVGCGGGQPTEVPSNIDNVDPGLLPAAIGPNSGLPVQYVTGDLDVNEPEIGEALPVLTPTPLPAPTPEPTPVPEPEPEPVPASSLDSVCLDTNLSADSVVIPAFDKPAPFSPYKDPAFGSDVVRITNSPLGEVNKPLYSTMQAWNADESLLLLYRTGASDSGYKLHDGHSYRYIQDIDIRPSDIEQIYWSRTDPDSLFYVSKSPVDYGELKRYTISTASSVRVADFSNYCGSGLPGGGSDPHMHSVTDEVFGFSCRQDDGHHLMLSYQVSTDSIVTAPIGMGTAWSSWGAPVPTASGDRFWLDGKVIGADLTRIERTLDLSSSVEHSNLGQTATGEDAYYQVSFAASPNGCDGDLYNGVGHLIEHNLETGECRSLVSQEQGYPYPTSGTHISAQAYRQTDRVAVSSIGRLSQFDHFENAIPAPALLSEIYLVQTTKEDKKVCRLAHHRSFGKAATRGDYTPYFGEPHATISPSGTRIIFGSDWYDSGSVDSYVIELPDYVGR